MSDELVKVTENITGVADKTRVWISFDHIEVHRLLGVFGQWGDLNSSLDRRLTGRLERATDEVE